MNLNHTITYFSWEKKNVSIPIRDLMNLNLNFISPKEA